MKQVAESLVRELLDRAPDAIIGVDEAGTIVLVNARVEALFGYSRDELVGRPVEILVPERARPGHPGRRHRYADAPVLRPMGAGVQLAARRRDGSEFPADISLSAIETPSGRLVSAAIRDVSDRIEAEAERARLHEQAARDREERRHLQAQRLESLGQLAGGVAHDFNNLIAAISNYAAFVREAIERGVAETASSDGLSSAAHERWRTAQRDIAQIERAADAAAGLTRQLLSFARREVVRPTLMDLDGVVEEVESLLRRTIGEDIDLVVRRAGGLGIEADPGQLQQLLMNVAINARHAMPEGGRLTIDTAAVELVGPSPSGESAAGSGRLEPGSYARLRVTDTGHGMDAATVARAFEPFFTTRPPGEGTGLGLATVYGIATQAGGDVMLQSRRGAGTTITVWFPLRPDAIARGDPADRASTANATGEAGSPAAAADGPAGATAVDASGATVLVLDDEDGIRDIAERILSRNGYRVLVAATGLEAITIAERHPGPIDVLLTDAVMPRMSGRIAADAIVASRPSVRVLFMSGYASGQFATGGTLDRDVDLIEKPFTEATLLGRIRAALAR